ncbi:MAG: TRAP transporter fused permease subunit [Desulfuromonadales bacterium]|uniref:TRAP transporter fused permease subunit n=1 Tax=Desulfuromonas sp. KJ2020 TaxID=2919173 RepID=UPI0020A792AB|nr:TRAP transporter fused permease subunit [Desulfuromonas sp. KJ2020]MCP3177245.1 TRAP transporter fused permease subunit [Desulfuromonas sp. KJ2020]
MSEENNQELEDLSPEEQKKLKKLMEKDAKSYRSPTGFFKGLVALLGAGMVIFYFYTAGLAAVATQYHRGVYVFATYVLVFLLYPAGKGRIRVPLTAVLSIILSMLGTALLFFSDMATFHARLLEIGDHYASDGLGGAIASASGLWQVGVGAVLIFALVTIGDNLLMRRSGSNPTISDILFALLSAAVVYYWMHEFENLNYRAGAENELDAMVSIVGVFLSLEVCRRVLGWSMTLIGIGMLIYGYFGPYFPDMLSHRGFGIERLATALYLTTNGVFGVMANVLATYVILFIFFGAFLHKSGAGKFFIDLPLAIAGNSTGGPAKVAVMASALFGSVSGSAIANTVSTGAFTIPLMKRAGFKPHVAGAIEPAASIGGMFLPPIMGAGGFLMAELTNTSYATIMMIAVFPALLYFFSVFCMIHFEAKKQGLKGIKGEEFPHWKIVLKREWYFSLPLIIITVLMILGRSPGYSAFWATISCVVISWFRKETRMGLREIWEAILTGANNTLIIGATLGVIGIIVGTISLTGIGLKFSDIIISMAQGNLLMALLLVGLASLVLGMGVPVTAAYLITAVLAVPPLVEMGVPVIAAHMIVYWFSQDSNITPPVCVAAYAGAAIAGSDPWKTGWTSFKFAKLLYVMPILFAFTPSILFQAKPINVKMPEIHAEVPFASVLKVDVKEGDEFVKGDVLATVLVEDKPVDIKARKDGRVTQVKTFAGGLANPGDVLIEGEIVATKTKVFSSFLSAFLGTIAFSSLTMFFWIRRTSIPEWLILAAATILLYWPTLVTDAIGIGLVAIVFIMQKAKNKREQALAA